MPRGSNRSSGGFGSRSSSRSASPSYSSNQNRGSAQHQTPVNTQSRPPMTQPSSGGMMSGIGSTIVQGMAFGAGSEIAHQAVRSMMGGSSGHSNPPQQQQQQQQMPVENQNQNYQNQQKANPCADYNFGFVNCLKVNDNNISTCQSFFDDLKSCEKSLI